jgi:hypothetical protein
MWCHLVVLIARAAYRMVSSVTFVKGKNYTPRPSPEPSGAANRGGYSLSPIDRSAT